MASQEQKQAASMVREMADALSRACEIAAEQGIDVTLHVTGEDRSHTGAVIQQVEAEFSIEERL